MSCARRFAAAAIVDDVLIVTGGANDDALLSRVDTFDVGGASSFLVTFICALCTLRTQISRPIYKHR
jgi:hypothetical protein